MWSGINLHFSGATDRCVSNIVKFAFASYQHIKGQPWWMRPPSKDGSFWLSSIDGQNTLHSVEVESQQRPCRPGINAEMPGAAQDFPGLCPSGIEDRHDLLIVSTATAQISKTRLAVPM